MEATPERPSKRQRLEDRHQDQEDDESLFVPDIREFNLQMDDPARTTPGTADMTQANPANDSDDAMTPEEALFATKESPYIDLTERWWQYQAIKMVVNQDELYYQAAQAAYTPNPDQLTAESMAWQREQEEASRQSGSSMVHAGPVSPVEMAESRKLEEMLRHLETEYTDTAAAKLRLGLDPNAARLPRMPRSVNLKPWQFSGIDAVDVIAAKFDGVLLADAMGLGKTPIYIANLLLKMIKRETDRQAGLDVGLARVHMICVPPNLVRPTIRKVRDFSEGVVIYEYCGDGRRAHTADGARPIEGTLSKDHEILDGSQRNEDAIIVTSYNTWATRHGPQMLLSWRLETLGYTLAQAKAPEKIPDFDCPYLLDDKIDTMWLDEATEIKRPDSPTSLALQWVKPKFTGLATATPGLDRLEDYRGYLKFIQPRIQVTEQQLAEWRLACERLDTFNPYEIGRHEPAAVLRLHEEYAERFIFRNDDVARAGVYLARMAEMFVIRRTYASKIGNKFIADHVPGMVRRHIDAEYTLDQYDTYKAYAKHPMKKLMTMLPDGKITWNRKHFRTLILNSTWLGFEHLKDEVHASNLKYWKSHPYMLHAWLTRVHVGNPDLVKQVPDQDDFLGQIRVVCQSSPKIQSMLAIIGEVVVKHERKAAVWTLFPAEQLLVNYILEKLELDPIMYSSDLSNDEKGSVTAAFNDDQRGSKIFVTSFSLSSYGLALQDLCSDTIHLDIPMSRAIRQQAEHRFRRIGQTREVISWNISVRHTINDRQYRNNFRKALPQVASELNSQTFDIKSGAGEVDELSLGYWVIWDKQLTPYDDPVISSLAESERPGVLEPQEVLEFLIEEEEGTEVKINFNK